MSDVIIEQGRVQRKPSRAESKADITNRTARTILGAEAQKREAKTARLREARLAQEAEEQPATPAPLKPQHRKASVLRRISLST
jgi:hypothetical protein